MNNLLEAFFPELIKLQIEVLVTGRDAGIAKFRPVSLTNSCQNNRVDFDSVNQFIKPA